MCVNIFSDDHLRLKKFEVYNTKYARFSVRILLVHALPSSGLRSGIVCAYHEKFSHPQLNRYLLIWSCSAVFFAELKLLFVWRYDPPLAEGFDNFTEAWQRRGKTPCTPDVDRAGHRCIYSCLNFFLASSKK